MTVLEYLKTLTLIAAALIGTYRVVAMVDAATRLALALRGISSAPPAPQRRGGTESEEMGVRRTESAAGSSGAPC